MWFLLFLTLALLSALDNYTKSGTLFDMHQLLDTSQPHHEHFTALFTLLAVYDLLRFRPQ
jgi:hypothetical protein